MMSLQICCDYGKEFWMNNNEVADKSGKERKLPTGIAVDNIPDNLRTAHVELANKTTEEIVKTINSHLHARDDPVRVEKSDIHGYGLFAITDISEGDVICPYWGEIVASGATDLVSRRLEMSWHGVQLYIMGSQMCAATWSNDAWGPERYKDPADNSLLCAVEDCGALHVPWGTRCVSCQYPGNDESDADIDLTSQVLSRHFLLCSSVRFMTYIIYVSRQEYADAALDVILGASPVLSWHILL